jgi:phosphatidylglycerol---prolipoprotein diacylglyceryl transferase
MHPILYQSPGFILYTQTVLFCVAAMTGLLLAIHEGRRLGIPQFELINVVLVGFLSSLAGGRAAFLLLPEHAGHFSVRELCTLGDLDGGFAFHGGLVFGGLSAWLLTRRYRLSVWRMGDALAPGLALALCFLRLGCLLNGCDYGVPTSVPWGIVLHGRVRHPIQLYEGLGNLALLPLIVRLNRRTDAPPGTAVWTYLCLSSVLRCGVDVFRDDSFRYGHLTIPQWLALALAVAAGALLWQKTFRPASITRQA